MNDNIDAGSFHGGSIAPESVDGGGDARSLGGFITVTSKTSAGSSSAFTFGKNKTKADDSYKNPSVAKAEEQRVQVSKYTMLAVLAVVAIGLSVATFWILQVEEDDNFRKQFENDASEIITVSTESVQNTFDSLEAFATSITSLVKQQGDQQWPFVTIPDYAARGEDMSKGAGAFEDPSFRLTFAPIVPVSLRKEFEGYAHENLRPSIQEDFDYMAFEDVRAEDIEGIPDRIMYTNLTTRTRFNETDDEPEYLVNWQRFPFDPTRHFVLTNMLRLGSVNGNARAANLTKSPTVSFFAGLNNIRSQIIQPIFEDVYSPHHPQEDRKMVGVLWLLTDWGRYFENLLPEGRNGTHLVLESSCGLLASFVINGLNAEFLGFEDVHEKEYEQYEIESTWVDLGSDKVDDLPEDVCVDVLTIHMYPSAELREQSTSSKPIVYACCVVGIFVFTVLVFLIYDWNVNSRQRKVMARVITQDKLVSNLFPASIRDRLYGIGDQANGGDQNDGDNSSMGGSSAQASKQLIDFGDGAGASPAIYGSRPLADLFLETTVLFADIAGFTAWSSAREPSQVFTLLENIYGAFDRLAHKHGVFKVETIGDCYVAVTGLPDPNKNHASIMAKFARDCNENMKIMTSRLEIALGPDTGDLDIRIGMHSGQVTAGVLRGERSRFQLFGDTVNTAARMESTGIRCKIQVSNVTAELLKVQGRSKWVHAREETISVHGKGMMQTYWLETKEDSEERHKKEKLSYAAQAGNFQSTPATSHANESSESSDMADVTETEVEEDDLLIKGEVLTKKERLVEWNVEILSDLLKRIIAARTKKPKDLNRAEKTVVQADTVLEEFKEIIKLPKVSMEELKLRKDPDYIMLDAQVVSQLRTLISGIADMYNDNSFHNFEHASHVTASVAKLLTRIVQVDTTNQTSNAIDRASIDIAGHSYGITSDPLTQFAVVFSAIIHDADHPGVPNAQLVKEQVPMAAKYKEKSVAEQNSVDLVWALLMEPQFVDLRSCIYADEEELKRFRQLIVNVVMATDIVDKELGALRKARWNTAFSEQEDCNNKGEDATMAKNRKATIVLEHLIQASDVSHTMQHWQVYKKWNEMFFMECYGAFQSGRAETDPSENWYKGEIGFFDFYVIPLAKKLDNCGVFGVSSHEYLNYATANRDEWARKGEKIVKEYIAAYGKKHSA